MRRNVTSNRLSLVPGSRCYFRPILWCVRGFVGFVVVKEILVGGSVGRHVRSLHRQSKLARDSLTVRLNVAESNIGT